ncbi:MAG: hypothetical protein OXD36_09345 [Rhodobacter sp.]|nr:hypothetical protein [Rhodospirillaceae bacterium]MCY4241933.1 hypothetical protein [Rhodobacter sp.]MCY4311744.1 hypothetical protein [Rhodospirillaceae bacterium]
MADISMPPKERRLLDSILDQLVPGSREKSIPGAGEIGVADYLAGVATRRPDFGAALRRLLARASGLGDRVDPVAVRQLERAMPKEFADLLTETYKGYYSRPDMRAKVGVGAHPVHPSGYEVAQESAGFIEGLVEPVRARGPFYRDPDIAGGS